MAELHEDFLGRLRSMDEDGLHSVAEDLSSSSVGMGNSIESVHQLSNNNNNSSNNNDSHHHGNENSNNNNNNSTNHNNSNQAEGSASSSSSSSDGNPPKLTSGLFSKISEVFLATIPLKDFSTTSGQIIYRDAFRGSVGLSWICSMCNLSLEGGSLLCQQMLDAKVFFVAMPETSDADNGPGGDTSEDEVSTQNVFMPIRTRFYTIFQSEGLPEPEPPCSVFTSLCSCYSPSCRSGALCYSPLCPRASWRIHVAPSSETQFLDSSQGLHRSLTFTVETHAKKSDELYWKDTVSEEVYGSVSKKERDRQEAIFALISSERLYLADLKYVAENLLNPITEGRLFVKDPYKFATEVCGELPRLIEIESKLLVRLEDRQNEAAIVSGVGDIYLELLHSGDVGAYVVHAPSLILGVEYMQSEISKNRFLEEHLTQLQRKPESRRLSMRSFLDRPRQYLTKLLVHFETIMKQTEEQESQDMEDLSASLGLLKGLLARLDEATAPAQTELVLQRLESRLVSTKECVWQLKECKLLRCGTLKKIVNTGTRDMEFYLFDNCLLVTKVVPSKDATNRDPSNSGLEFVTLYPFDKLLVLTDPQQPKLDIVRTVRGKSSRATKNSSVSPSGSLSSAPAGMIMPRNLESSSTAEAAELFYLDEASKEKKQIPLFRPDSQLEPSWIASIEKAQEKYFASMNLKIAPISLHDFPTHETISWIDFILDDEEKIVKYLVGTSTGIYMTPVKHENQVVYFRKLYSIEHVKQIKHVAKFQCLLLIAGGQSKLGIISASSIETNRVTDAQPTYVKDSEGTEYFVYDEEDNLVCFAKNKTVGESSIKLEELVQTRHEALPTLRKRDKYGCSDQCQKFLLLPDCIVIVAQHRLIRLERSSKTSITTVGSLTPIAIFEVGDLFLVCCQDGWFFVDKKLKVVEGRRKISTTTFCNSFLISSGRLFCVSDQLVEVYDVETGRLICNRSLMNGRIISGCSSKRIILSATPRSSDKQHLLQMEML